MRLLACEGHLQAMVVIHHGGYAIKAVPIKLVLVNPEARVGQQEAQGLPVACRPARRRSLHLSSLSVWVQKMFEAHAVQVLLSAACKQGRHKM